MTEILKLFNGTTETDMQSGGTFCGVSWEALMPAIKELIRFRDDEVIDGFKVNGEGIRIKLSRKPGPKRIRKPAINGTVNGESDSDE